MAIFVFAVLCYFVLLFLYIVIVERVIAYFRFYILK